MHKFRSHLRTIALAGLLLLILADPAACYAKQDYRYVKIAGNSLYTYYLDTATVRYIPDPYVDEQLIDAWLKITASTDTDDNIGYSIRRYYFRMKERQMQLLATQDFAANGTPLAAEKYSYAAARWDDIAPNTLGDVWYDQIRTQLESKQQLTLAPQKQKR